MNKKIITFSARHNSSTCFRRSSRHDIPLRHLRQEKRTRRPLQGAAAVFPKHDRQSVRADPAGLLPAAREAVRRQPIPLWYVSVFDGWWKSHNHCGTTCQTRSYPQALQVRILCYLPNVLETLINFVIWKTFLRNLVWVNSSVWPNIWFCCRFRPLLDKNASFGSCFGFGQKLVEFLPGRHWRY